MAVPDAGHQVAFLSQVQRLLRDGQFTATYKFALLLALVDVAIADGDDSGAPLVVPVRRLAESFVSTYWPHARPFLPAGRTKGHVLFQNQGQQAAVITALEACRARGYQSLGALRRDLGAWRKTLNRVATTVRVMPLGRLQTVGGEHADFLYEIAPDRRSITLRAGVAYCLRQFDGLIRELARNAWINFVRGLPANAGILGPAGDLHEFLFGAPRGDLTALVPPLHEIQDGRCFYCARRFDPARPQSKPVVDHFVPRVLFPADLGHNLVLAHAACNGHKLDSLAAYGHLERLSARNLAHGSTLQSLCEARNVLAPADQARAVVHWAYAQAAGAESRVWIRGRTFGPLDDRWSALPWLRSGSAPPSAAPSGPPGLRMVRAPSCPRGGGWVRCHADLLVAASWLDAALAHEVDEASGAADWVRVPSALPATPEHFVARVVGESMNRLIPNGAWGLFRVERGGSRIGRVVLVRHGGDSDPDLGEYTLKVYGASVKREFNDETWEHERIVLEPRSDHPAHQAPFVLDGVPPDEFRVLAEFVAVLPS